MIPETVHLNIGSLLFENLDQIDLTGPFEVLSRLPNATHRIYAKSRDPVRDVMGLRIMPDATLAEAPQLDILHVPGGPGQEALMEDEEVLGWLRSQAAGREEGAFRLHRRAPVRRRGSHPGKGRRRTGRRSTFCPTSARSQSTSGSWSTETGSSPPASTSGIDAAPSACRRGARRRRPPNSSSSTSPTRQSRRFRAGRPIRRLRRSWKGRVEIRLS